MLAHIPAHLLAHMPEHMPAVCPPSPSPSPSLSPSLNLYRGYLISSSRAGASRRFFPVETCGKVEGSIIMATQQPPPVTKPCPNCKGTGQMPDETTCPMCDGTGEIPASS